MSGIYVNVIFGLLVVHLIELPVSVADLKRKRRRVSDMSPLDPSDSSVASGTGSEADCSLSESSWDTVLSNLQDNFGT
jgi:hypothetical protein